MGNSSSSNEKKEEPKESLKDSVCYQGLNFKLDIGNAAFMALKSKGATQQYELAMNVNLYKRFYPTLELGYAWSTDHAEAGNYWGTGGFMRLGLDINPLRKNRNNYYALLVGLRFGMALQNYNMTNINLNDSYWNPGGTYLDYPNQVRFDCWGEIVAGTQIMVAGPFTMGWFIRFHALFTGNAGDHKPYFIPGMGNPDGSFMSLNYYLGFRLDSKQPRKKQTNKDIDYEHNESGGE